MASVFALSLISKVCEAAHCLSTWWRLLDGKFYHCFVHDCNFEAAGANHLLVAFLVFATTITVAWWWYWSRRETPPLPPGPRGLPVVGNLPFISTELHQSFSKLAEAYGPIMTLRLGNKLCVVVTSPSLAKEVLNDHDTVFANRDVIVAAAIASYGGVDMVWSPYGDHWRMLRKVCVSEMLNHKRLETLYSLRRNEVHRMVSQLCSEAGSAVDVGDLMFLAIFNVISSMLWGATLEGEEGRRTTVKFRHVMDRILMLHGEPNISDLYPALAWLDIQGIGRRMKKEFSWFDQMLDLIIDEWLRREREEERGNQRQEAIKDGKQAKHLLQVLLQRLNSDLKAKEGAPNNTTPGLTISHIKALFLDMMIGGTKTSSSAVEWGLAELLKHPHTMKKAQEELEKVVGLNNMVEESHLPKLHYLHGVLKEVLRLHPPAPFLVPRCPSESCTIGGFTVPKGSKVIVNAWAIQRDPIIWDNPLEFQPERFLRSGSNDYDFSGKDFRYFPFGSGRRVCVGIPLAERMVPYLLASILHSFKWQLPNGVELDMSDKFGLELKKATPLVAIPTPRFSDLTL